MRFHIKLHSHQSTPHHTHIMVVCRVDVDVPVVSAAASTVNVSKHQPDAALDPLGVLVAVVDRVTLAAILVQCADHHSTVCNGDSVMS